MKKTLKANILGQEYHWHVELDTTNPLVVEATRKGFQEWLQDATANPEVTKEEEKHADMVGQDAKRDSAEYKRYLKFMQGPKLRAVETRLKKIVDGTYKPGSGGGGGSRTTLEEEAWLDFCNAKGMKESKKPIIKKTLRRAQETLCRQFLLAEHDAGTDERAAVEKDMATHLAERFNDWHKGMEADEDGVGGYIAIKRMMEKMNQKVGK